MKATIISNKRFEYQYLSLILSTILPFLKEATVDFDNFSDVDVVLDVTVCSIEDNVVDVDKVLNLVDLFM